jgi:DNA-binding MarR family transcriptional regulator
MRSNLMKKNKYQMSSSSIDEKGGYFKLFRSVARRTDLTMTAKLLYMVIRHYEYFRKKTNSSFRPSLKRFGEDLGVSKVTILRALKELENMKLIVVVRQKNQLIRKVIERIKHDNL